MLAWAAYALLVSLLLGLAAAAAERALRAYDLPARGAWAAALLASLGLPAAAWLSGGSPAAAPALPALGVGEAVYTVGGRLGAGGGGLSLPSLEAALPALWGFASLAALAWLGSGLLRLRRSLDELPTRSVGGVDVHLSEESGPACWLLPGGRARVVVPTWLRRLAPDLRRLALEHERRHLRSGDSLLIAGGFLLAAAAPWNLPLWWQLRRLRRSVELDCDGRVLRAGADPREYGRLLLAVGSRGPASAWSALPLSEDATQLERRILNMTPRSTKARLLRVSLFVLLAAGAGGLACETSPPSPDADADERPEVAAEGTALEKPVSDFEVAPALQNPREVQTRLQAVYPDRLKEQGTGGEVVLQLRVDEQGRVRESRIAEPSEHPEFDAAARRVVEAMEFEPARSDGEPKAVWVRQMVRFRVSGDEAGSSGGEAGGEFVRARVADGPDILLRREEHPTVSVADSEPEIYVDGERVEDRTTLESLNELEIRRIEVDKSGETGKIMITTKDGGQEGT